MPGQWQGDRLIGKRNQTAIGTLVERSSGFAMLVAMPDGYNAGIDVFFCDPHTPWQRSSNENTNGLLRHYFP